VFKILEAALTSQVAGLANQIHDSENDKANYHPLVHVLLGTADWEIFVLKVFGV